MNVDPEVMTTLDTHVLQRPPKVCVPRGTAPVQLPHLNLRMATVKVMTAPPAFGAIVRPDVRTATFVGDDVHEHESPPGMRPCLYTMATLRPLWLYHRSWVTLTAACCHVHQTMMLSLPLWFNHPVLPRGNPCTARALRATFRLCSLRTAPRHGPWKHPQN